jgi:hypothetical protein
MYEKILMAISGLEEHTKWTMENEPSKLNELATFVCARY